MPTITWKIQNKDGNWQNLVHGQDNFEIASAFQGRLLNIISVKKSMHETRYRCEAENSESGGSPLVHDIQLNVEGKCMALGPSQSHALIPLNENKPHSFYFPKAVFEGLIYGGKFVSQNRLG